MFGKKNKRDERSVEAVLYPEKIIIATRHRRDEFTWVTTDILTILPITITDIELGEIINEYLKLSEEREITTEQMKMWRESYRKKAKFKTEKSIMDNARYVSMYENYSGVRFEPKANKAAIKSFYGMPEEKFEIKNKTAEVIGNQLRVAWQKCIFL